MTPEPNKGIRLRMYEESPGTAYVELWDHPHRIVGGIVKRSVELHQIVENYDGPRLTLDFDGEGRPIGIEIIYPTSYGNEEEPRT